MRISYFKFSGPVLGLVRKIIKRRLVFAFRMVGWQKRSTLDLASMAPFRPLRAGVGGVGLAFADGIVPVMAAAAAARYRCQMIS
jgi:hypothetical protein